VPDAAPASPLELEPDAPDVAPDDPEPEPEGIPV
jgi:hypothetical protein